MALTDTLWTGNFNDKLFLTSGQFTSIIKTSENISAIESDVRGISWDGTNTLWIGFADNKLYLTSGQFSSTLKTSQSVSATDTLSLGIETNDVDARLQAPPPPPSGVIIFRRRIEGE